MEFVTISQVREALKHDEISGELVDANRAYRLNAQYVKLYDPPVDGKTPVDGAGEPAFSLIGARDSLKALDKGFTEEPVKAKR